MEEDQSILAMKIVGHVLHRKAVFVEDFVERKTVEIGDYNHLHMVEVEVEDLRKTLVAHEVDPIEVVQGGGNLGYNHQVVPLIDSANEVGF